MTITNPTRFAAKTIAFSTLLLCFACGNDANNGDDSMTTPMTTPDVADMSPEPEEDMENTGGMEDMNEEVADADMGQPEEDMSAPVTQACDATIETDQDGDGQVDSALFYRYDEQGRLVKIEKDNDFDQQLDAEEIYTYNDDGLVIKVEVDDDLDGTIDSETTVTYDAMGHEILRRTDQGLDGGYEMVTEQTWENGLLVERVQTEFDASPSRTLWTYTEFDEIATIELFSGTALQTLTTSFYDENNRLTHIEIEYYFGQPTVGMKTTRRFTYDAQDRLAKSEEYSEGDVLEQTVSYTYDENGNQLTERIDRASGASSETRREYDDQDRIIRYSLWSLMPETLIFESNTTFLCDAM
ncbi:MAG: hypothetical protein VYE40_03095 [Myxococcota bacterium]|nr:hypothetical protein [Myxococcota bacterium]MEC9440071.1 hypothetical protein [Myxococcota bacterium]